MQQGTEKYELFILNLKITQTFPGKALAFQLLINNIKLMVTNMFLILQEIIQKINIIRIPMCGKDYIN